MSAQNTNENRDTVNVVDFKDIPDDTIMYCGNIETVHIFRTKAEWLQYFERHSSVKSFSDYAYENCDEAYRPWYTATAEAKKITLDNVIELLRDEMYNDWDDDVSRELEGDSVVSDGIERMNEVFANYPTYFEDKSVRF
jgi:hypothetical protein